MSAARVAYTALTFVAIPFAMLYLLWRSRHQPEYQLYWGERFGFARYAFDRSSAVIWIHAVSLGETRAAEPLIDALCQRYPQHRILLTHMTPTGRAAGAEIAKRRPDRVVQSYLPYDMPYAVRRFFAAFRPVIGIVVETETWPNLLAIAREQRIPMALVNARLSEKSYKSAMRVAVLMRETMRYFTLVLAQSKVDAERLRRLGAREVHVIGNIKFDFATDQTLVDRGAQWRNAQREQPVWLLASTRESEEAMLLDALRADGNANRNAIVIIVPRHPQRFDEVARLIESRDIRFQRRTTATDQASGQQSGSDPDFLLGDTVGEMAMYYAMADVALIGGSLARLGGHNLIEACAVGTPVVIGPHTFNFEQATVDAIEAGAAVRVADAAEAFATMASIANDPQRRRRMSDAALRFSAAHRGATLRTVERLAPLIEVAVLSADSARAPQDYAPAAGREG